MHINEDLRAADAAATRDSVAVVAGVTTEDLTRPTPCAGWNLLGLLAHMTAQHHGFAAAARGHGEDEAAWRPLMPAARDAAGRLADAGEVEVTQRGEVVDVRTARGPVRVRRRPPGG